MRAGIEIAPIAANSHRAIQQNFAAGRRQILDQRWYLGEGLSAMPLSVKSQMITCKIILFAFDFHFLYQCIFYLESSVSYVKLLPQIFVFY